MIIATLNLTLQHLIGCKIAMPRPKKTEEEKRTATAIRQNRARDRKRALQTEALRQQNVLPAPDPDHAGPLDPIPELLPAAGPENVGEAAVAHIPEDPVGLPPYPDRIISFDEAFRAEDLDDEGSDNEFADHLRTLAQRPPEQSPEIADKPGRVDQEDADFNHLAALFDQTGMIEESGENNMTAEQLHGSIEMLHQHEGHVAAPFPMQEDLALDTEGNEGINRTYLGSNPEPLVCFELANDPHSDIVSPCVSDCVNSEAGSDHSANQPDPPLDWMPDFDLDSNPSAGSHSLEFSIDTEETWSLSLEPDLEPAPAEELALDQSPNDVLNLSSSPAGIPSPASYASESSSSIENGSMSLGDGLFQHHSSLSAEASVLAEISDALDEDAAVISMDAQVAQLLQDSWNPYCHCSKITPKID